LLIWGEQVRKIAPVILVMLSVAAAAGESSPVSEGELNRLFPGAFEVVASGVMKIQVMANGDGSLSAEKADDSDTGRWNIEAGKLCIRFSKWLKGEVRCSAVTADGEWYRATDIAFKKVPGGALSSQ
jgi:hypothetical protein